MQLFESCVCNKLIVSAFLSSIAKKKRVKKRKNETTQKWQFWWDCKLTQPSLLCLKGQAL